MTRGKFCTRSFGCGGLRVIAALCVVSTTLGICADKSIADTLDWSHFPDNMGWGEGQLSGSATVGTTLVTATFDGSIDMDVIVYPALTDAHVFDFGLHTANANGDPGTGQTLTINFGHEVSNVSFSIFDVDRGGSTFELVTVEAFDNGSPVVPTLASTGITPPAFDIMDNVASSEFGFGVFGQNEEQGQLNVDILGPLDRVVVTFTNGGSSSSPIREITFSNITFVPEPSTLLALGSLSLLVMDRCGRRRRRQNSS